MPHRTVSTFCLMLVSCLALVATRLSAAEATATIHIIVGTQASELERIAADELESMLERLYEVDATIIEKPVRSTAQIVIGRPETNSTIKQIFGDDWPQLSDQGVLLRSFRGADNKAPPLLVVGGGSDVACLWAAYELGERLGVRYLHHRDVYPEQREWKGLPDLDVVMEPNLKIRCWRLVNDLPFGPVSWSLDENKRFLRQMAKMKFNRIRVQFWPAQPFVHYTIRGKEKPKGTIYFGSRFPVDDDTIGREKFGDIGEFTNPEFVGADTAAELHERAANLVRGIMAEARSLGMEVAIGFEPVEWPKEFIEVLPGTELARQSGDLTIGPGASQSMDDPSIREATATVIKAYRDTYPDIDYLIFSMPEHGHWVGHAEEAYNRLMKSYRLTDIDSYESFCERARARTNFPGGGERVERQLKSDLCSLWFIDSIIRENELLKRPGKPDIKLVYDSLCDELLPLVAQVVPEGGETISFVDYTASRQLQRKDLLEVVPPKKVPASLIFTLADDNVGVLPQCANGSLHQLMNLLRQYKWSGFYTRYWTISELDPTIHLIARGSWDADLTPRDCYVDQIEHVCGHDAVAPALAAFEIVEEITLGLDQHGLGFGFPVPGMMTKHYSAGGLSVDIRRDQAKYREALEMMTQAHEASRAEGRDYTGYFVNRLKFADRYLTAADAFGKTATALSENNRDEARKQIDIAYKSIRAALEAYLEVARDHGDLGAIAAMNEYCYRPIRDKREELKK